MRFVINILVLALGISTTQAAPLLSATIIHESQTIGNDGVTRTSVFQERMYRDERNIWVERILPKHHQHGAEAHQHSHKHLDLAEAAQHYFIDNNKKANLNLVLIEDKTVVHLKDVDVEMIGLNNCWSCVYSLIDPKLLKTMAATKKANGITVYQSKNNKNNVIVEWDEKQQIAKRVDIRALNGLSYTTLKANIRQVNITEPWKKYSHFMSKDYADFGD